VITEALLEGMNTKYLAERTVGRSLKITPPVQFHGRIISRRILRWERRCKGDCLRCAVSHVVYCARRLDHQITPSNIKHRWKIVEIRVEQHRKDKETSFAHDSRCRWED
jgi:hypothetical protein